MELFFTILHILNHLGIQYKVYEDLSFDIVGNIPRFLSVLISRWYQINDFFSISNF